MVMGNKRIKERSDRARPKKYINKKKKCEENNRNLCYRQTITETISLLQWTL